MILLSNSLASFARKMNSDAMGKLLAKIE